MGFIIELFDSSKHNRAAFCCGKDSLDNYIRKQASQDVSKRVSTVFVLVDSPQTDIIGYYTLSSYTVELSELDNSFAKRLPHYPLLPATLLGRLGIDRNYRGQHLGELLLINALERALSATLQVASLAVVAEALDEQAVTFYQKYGFQVFKQHSMTLCLPMKTVEELCQMLNT
ncbi:GNAT family N-acetyltransferase [cyanobacterium TDX16]|nr:GNAT family N-acetyltransferase [cyanobacterium TDX16]